VVEEILAEPGQIVDKGQPLMRLQEVISDSDLSALRVRTHNLALLKETLEALLTGRAADFSSLGKLNAALMAEHRQAYRLRLDHRVKEHALLLTRIAHRKAEIASLQNEIETQRKLVEIQSEQLAMRRSLAVDGNMSRKQVLDTEAVYEQSRVLLQASEGKLLAKQEALNEADAALAESDAQAHKLWSEELAKASSELVEVQESIRKHADRVERLTIRAPTRGRVQQVLQRSPGEVVRPGETMARIVPLDDALVGLGIRQAGGHRLREAQGQGRPQSHRVRLQQIRQDQGRSRIHLSRHCRERRQAYLLQGPDQLQAGPIGPVRQGMASAAGKVDAEIISGSKSLLQYMLKPIHRGIDVAFSER
jgi:HlyD family secretion protein/adhesin transport system membrane fusion protein